MDNGNEINFDSNRKKKYKLWKKIKKEIMDNKTISKDILIDNYIMLLAYIEHIDKVKDLYDFAIEVNNERRARGLNES